MMPLIEDPSKVYTILSYDGPAIKGLEVFAKNGKECDIKYE